MRVVLEAICWLYMHQFILEKELMHTWQNIYLVKIDLDCWYMYICFGRDV